MPLWRSLIVIAFLSPSLTAFAQTGPAALDQRACREDASKFCSNVQPGGGRIVLCLANNRAKLSEPCRKVLDARGPK